MALIKCPKCGGKVSDRAVKCPHCGCDPKEKGVAEKPNEVTPKEESHSTPIIEKEERSSKSGKIIIIILLVVIILAIIGFFGYQKFAPHDTYDIYDIPTDTTAVDSFDSDTTAVDTVAIDDTQAKLEEFKSFTSNDLAAFNLHGKVKMVKEGVDKMYFDENGTLTRYVDAWGETKIEHNSDELYISSQGSGSFWTTVRDGKVVKTVDDASMGVRGTNLYSNYDANNCPTRMILKLEGIDGDEFYSKYIFAIKYSDYDAYGNYRKMTEMNDDETHDVVTRTITYYPIEE